MAKRSEWERRKFHQRIFRLFSHRHKILLLAPCNFGSYTSLAPPANLPANRLRVGICRIRGICIRRIGQPGSEKGSVRLRSILRISQITILLLLCLRIFDWSLKGLKAQPTTSLCDFSCHSLYCRHYHHRPGLATATFQSFASSCEFEYLILHLLPAAKEPLPSSQKVTVHARAAVAVWEGLVWEESLCGNCRCCWETQI